SVGSPRARCRPHAHAGRRADAAEPTRRRTAMAEGRRDMEPPSLSGRGISRRTVLRGSAVGTTVLVAERLARGASSPAPAYVPRPNPRRFDIVVGRAPTTPDGAQAVPAVVAGGHLPGPDVRVREGDTLRILVENQLADAPTSIHWHGMLVPAAMDGVPDVSNVPIAPGRTYVYEYPIRQSGTYWYHSHFGFQEQQGCYGALIVDPAHGPRLPEREAVILLGDWLHRNPVQVFDELKTPKEPMGGMKPDGAQPGGMKMAGGGADLAD